MKYLCLIYENEKNYETMSPADGEAIIFRPDGTRGEIVAHVRIEDWPQLAAAS